MKQAMEGLPLQREYIISTVRVATFLAALELKQRMTWVAPPAQARHGRAGGGRVGRAGVGGVGMGGVGWWAVGPRQPCAHVRAVPPCCSSCCCCIPCPLPGAVSF